MTWFRLSSLGSSGADAEPCFLGSRDENGWSRVPWECQCGVIRDGFGRIWFGGHVKGWVKGCQLKVEESVLWVEGAIRWGGLAASGHSAWLAIRPGNGRRKWGWDKVVKLHLHDYSSPEGREKSSHRGDTYFLQNSYTLATKWWVTRSLSGELLKTSLSLGSDNIYDTL